MIAQRIEVERIELVRAREMGYGVVPYIGRRVESKGAEKGVEQLALNRRQRAFFADRQPEIVQFLASAVRPVFDQALGDRDERYRQIKGYREHGPDITLMDLQMPAMTGLEAMVAIRKEFPEARVIILTTYETKCKAP